MNNAHLLLPFRVFPRRIIARVQAFEPFAACGKFVKYVHGMYLSTTIALFFEPNPMQLQSATLTSAFLEIFGT